VILVSIPAIGSENQVRRNCQLEVFKNPFDLFTYERHESVLESLELRTVNGIRAGKQRRRALCLSGPGTSRAKHNPMEHAARILLGQTKDCPATANFDIVGVCSQAQDVKGRFRIAGQT
jgi:hypothetical protein